MADNKPKVDTKEIGSDLTKAVTNAITEGFKNATSSFSGLSRDLSTAITDGFKGGTEKSKKFFEGKTLLEAMKEDLKEMADYQKESAFQAKVQAIALSSGRAPREIELDLLNQAVQTKQQEVTEQYNLNRALAIGTLQQAMMNGDAEGALEIRKELAAMAQEQAAAKEEAEETDLVNKQLIKQLATQREIAKEEKSKQAVIDKMKEVKDNLKAQLGITEKLRDQFKTKEMAKAVFAEQMIEKIGQAGKSFEEFRVQGLSSGQAVQGMFKGMNVMSMLGLSDTKGVLEGVVSQYGNINALSRETVGELGHMAHEMGITGQEALGVNASLSQMPGETSETAANAMKLTGNLAKASGIAPGKIMKDMAKNSELMALGGYKSAKAFGEAAIKAHKMGVDLATTKNVASGLLDFESSISKQMEASVLLGREINFDKARELALQGKTVEATAEVLKNIGGQAEFEKMNVLQKQALAAATGMTVEELQKAADAQQEQNKYSGEGAGIMSRALGGVMEYGGAAAGFLKENGMLLMTGMQLLSNTNAMQMVGNGIRKIGTGLQMGYNAALRVAKLLFAENNATEQAGFVKRNAQYVKDRAAAAFTGVKNFLKGGAGKVAAGATDKVTEAAGDKLKGAGGGKQTGGLTDAISKIDVKKVLAGAAALVLVAAAVYIFAKAAQEFTSVPWSSIGKAIISMLALVGALALIGAIMMSGVGALAIMAGAAAMLIMAAALYVLGKAIQEIAKGFDAFIPALIQLAPMASDLVKVGAGLIVVGAGLMALGTAALFSFGGLMLAAVGIGMLVPGLTLINIVASQGGFDIISQGMMMIGQAGPGLALVAVSMMGIAGGLGMMALSGMAAMPVIGMLIALATVAPALVALGGALGGMFGGGGGGKDEKMDVLIGKIDQLIAVASKGGTVNMDGKKVGEIVRLGINSSGVR